MIGENKPLAFRKPYATPIRVDKIGPRTMRVVDSVEVLGASIPAGYETDGASVPRPFWLILSPFAEGFRAALVHDFRHTQNGRLSFAGRRIADDEFFWNLWKREHLSFARAALSWLGVRLYAWATLPLGRWK